MKIKKHSAVLSAWLSTMFAYRSSMIVWAFGELISLASGLFIWTAIYRDQSAVAGYDLHQMILYYTLIPLIGSFTEAFVTSSLPNRIKNGDISIDLMKPYSIFSKTFFKSVSQVIMRPLLRLPALIATTALIFNLFGLTIQLKYIPIALLFCLGAQILHYNLGFVLSTAAFWIDEAWSLKLLKRIGIMVFGGMTFPLDLLPNNLQKIFSYLPFQFFYYFPVNIARGKATTQELVTGLVTMTAWTIALYITSKIFWFKGLNKYGAYGN